MATLNHSLSLNVMFSYNDVIIRTQIICDNVKNREFFILDKSLALAFLKVFKRTYNAYNTHNFKTQTKHLTNVVWLKIGYPNSQKLEFKDKYIHV